MGSPGDYSRDPYAVEEEGTKGAIRDNLRCMACVLSRAGFPFKEITNILHGCIAFSFHQQDLLPFF